MGVAVYIVFSLEIRFMFSSVVNVIYSSIYILYDIHFRKFNGLSGKISNIS